MSQDGRMNALYQRKSGAPAYTTGAYADRFDEAEADRRIKYKGKYTWVKYAVHDSSIVDYDLNTQERKLTTYSLEYRNRMRSNPKDIKFILFEARNAYDNVVEDADNNIKSTVKQHAAKHWSDLQKFAESLKMSAKDKLIQSSSEEAFNKNVATEIKAGKDPKQAVAIAYSVKRENDSTSLSDMALSRTDAMDRAISLGRQFIKHFDKIYKNPKDNAVEHWKSEMRTWFGDVKSIKLKSNHQPLLNSEIHDWFLTAGAEAQDFMKSPTQEEINAYDKFATEVLSSGINAALNNKEYFIHDNKTVEEKDSMIKDTKFLVTAYKDGKLLEEQVVGTRAEAEKLANQFEIKYGEYTTTIKLIHDSCDSVKDSDAFNGFAYMIKQYSSRPEQLIAVASKIKSANDLTSQEKQELLSRIESVKDSSIKDAYNKFANEKDIDFLKESLSEMRRYERNWSGMSAREKQNIAPGGISELRENIRNAEAQLKKIGDSAVTPSTLKVIAKKALEMQDGCSRHYLEVEDCDGKRFYMVTDEYDGCSKQFSGSGSVIEDKPTLSKKYKDDLASGLRSVGQSAVAGAKAVKRKLSGRDEVAIDSKMYATPLDNLIKCGQVKDGVSVSKVDAMLGINNVEATKQLLRDANIKYSPVTARVSEYRIVDGKCVKVDEQ